LGRSYCTCELGHRCSGNSDLVFSTSSPTRDVADYRKNAEKCYERAKQMAKPEDWEAYLEMAQTWKKYTN